MKTYAIPYSDITLPLTLPEEKVIFNAGLPQIQPMPNWQQILLRRLDEPTSGCALSELIKPEKHIVILVEDNTRHTPVKEMLPILCNYLCAHGCKLSQLEILIAPGTHRKMTDQELREKLGDFVMRCIRVSQHDYRDESMLVSMGTVTVDDMEIPVQVNRIAVEADILIGLGNIIPHPNAGFSGGAKILDPGCCGEKTISATHISAALMGFLPLGMVNNSCREGIEQVAQRVGLDFIINVVLDSENRVVDLVTGAFVQAQRVGASRAMEAFGVNIPAAADILISCAYPYDIDYWQCEKALISGYFAVKKGGTIILVAPCREGLAHNHDDLLSWLRMNCGEAKSKLRELWKCDEAGDIVAASIAIGALTVKEHAQIYIYSDGLSKEEISAMGYRGFESIQEAVEAALAENPDGTIGILRRGGDSCPVIEREGIEGEQT